MPFDHERLIVYQRAIELVAWVDSFIETAGLKGEIKSQLDRASMSVPLNIAEGNGRFSIPDRNRFLDIAYGSSLECAACLDVARAKRLATDDQIARGKGLLEESVNRFIRLRQSLEERNERGDNSPRVRELGPIGSVCATSNSNIDDLSITLPPAHLILEFHTPTPSSSSYFLPDFEMGGRG